MLVVFIKAKLDGSLMFWGCSLHGVRKVISKSCDVGSFGRGGTAVCVSRGEMC